ncbi:MAG: hypothetical protein OET63_06965 [Desulfobacterales bacterium]|nr:hypothetical protein [Desulfobacterales bacterium]
MLLEAGRAAEAESIYWQDLRRNRENGWSLFGLMRSLQAQGKKEQAVGIEARFQQAWNQAGVFLTASHFMGEARTTLVTTGAAVSDARR